MLSFMPSHDARIIEILNSDDPRIIEFSQIKERDLTRNTGQFIAEGKVVLQHLINSAAADNRFFIDKVFILKNRFAGLDQMLHALPQDIPIYVAERNIMDAVAGFPMHRGILALGRYDRSNELLSDLNSSSDGALVLAASGISNHDNLGSIFRNAAAFGVDRMLLDKTCCHPLYRKCIRVSVGSALTVPFQLDIDLAKIILDYKSQGFDVLGLTPSGSKRIEKLPKSNKILLLIGAEGEGLSPDILSVVDNIKIAQVAGLDSLNVATATGIALWQMASKMERI